MSAPFGPTAKLPTGRLRAGLATCAVLLLVGCGGPTVFAGKSNFAIAGTPPPPPPPPPPPARVELKVDKIEIKEKIQFDLNKATIKEVSHSLLDEVAKVIRDHPEIRKVSIEGHASSEGNDEYNLDLSDRRARAVKDYLVGKAIEPDRLASKGFGETVPIEGNDTEEAREKNRRVEFNIVERDASRAKGPPGGPTSQ